MSTTHHPIVLGIDPGPTKCGFALMTWPDATGKARVLRCGHAPLVDVLDAMHNNAVDVVAIEWPANYHPVNGARTRADVGRSVGQAKHMVATALVAGELAGAATAIGCSVARVTAADVRKAMAMRRNASDADVAATLGYLVMMPARTNEHARDAMAVAIVGRRMVAA